MTGAILETGELFTSRGSLGLLCKIPDSPVATVSALFSERAVEFAVSRMFDAFETFTFKRSSSLRGICSFVADRASPLCGCKSFTLSANTICTCCSSATGELTIRGSPHAGSVCTVLPKFAVCSDADDISRYLFKCLFFSGKVS